MCEDHVYVGRIQELGYSVCGKAKRAEPTPLSVARRLATTEKRPRPHRQVISQALTCSDVFFSLRVLL
jgi:hypothetical protein